MVKNSKIIVSIVLVISISIISFSVYIFTEHSPTPIKINLNNYNNTTDMENNVLNFVGSHEDNFNTIKSHDNLDKKNNTIPIKNKTHISNVVDNLNNYVESVFPKIGIPGSAIVVIYQGKIVYMKTLGVKKVGESDPIDINTIFQIGSNSKGFTSAAIAALVDEGKMNWDDLIRKYYPNYNEFNLSDPIATEQCTIRDLLSHRSGMYENAGNEHVIDFQYNFPEILFRMRYIPPESEFRTKFAYNNIMFSLAGESSARASGMDWGYLVKQKLFDPLNMTSTGTYFNDYISNPNYAATHYTVDGITYYVPPLNLDAMGPAGSISSSIKDMANWLSFQLANGQFNGQQVVSSKSLTETHTPQILIESSPTQDIYYGLGWAIIKKDGKTYIQHAGSTRLSASFMSFIPSEQLGIVVLANEGSNGATFGSVVANKLYELYFNIKTPLTLTSTPNIYRDLENSTYNPVPVKTTSLNPPPLPIENYTGIYYSNYYGNIKIEKSSETTLNLYAGNNPEPNPLSHYSGNTFKDDYHNTDVIFSKIEDGKPQEVFTERWEINGANGTFNRI